MSHTEAQASELWCPMVRIARREYAEPGPYIGEGEALLIVGGCNTDAIGRSRVPASCRCIASGCAMWRWVPSEPDTAPEVINNPDGSVQQTRMYYVAVQPTLGYCGLAGRPEVVA